MKTSNANVHKIHTAAVKCATTDILQIILWHTVVVCPPTLGCVTVADMRAAAEGIQMSRVTGTHRVRTAAVSQTDGRYLISGRRPLHILGELERTTPSLIPLCLCGGCADFWICGSSASTNAQNHSFL